MKRAIALALIATAVIVPATTTSAANAVGTAKPPPTQVERNMPLPKAIGKEHAATKAGETQVFFNDVLQAPGANWHALLARGTKQVPVEVAVVTATGTDVGLASGLRSSLVVRTVNLYYGFSLLYSTFRQTWGYHDGYVYYWPSGYVTCDSTGPTYNARCANPPYQEYGLYFNQGHTLWDAHLCSSWVNYLFSSFCLSDTHLYRWYTFNSDGSWWRYA